MNNETSAVRYDSGSVLRFERTPEGYLRGEAVVSRTGVFSYRNDDGTTRHELRHPDDILTQATIDSIKQIPVTMDHPDALVTADTAKALQIGYVGDTVRIDGKNIIASFTITDAAAVRDIDAGKRGLSLGYKVSDLKREDGIYNGQPYTHRQTGTVVNHLAVCAAGRVGPAASINLDGFAVQIETSERNDMTDTNAVTVNLDGLEYQAAPEVAKALDKQIARADAAEKSRADAEKAKDEMEAKLDEEKAKLEKRSDAVIAEMVAGRVKLLSQAGAYVKDAADLADKSDREIMEAVIATKYDKLDVSGKSDDYIRSRFDAVLEAADADKAAGQVKATTSARGDGKVVDYRADMIDAIKAQSNKKGA